jgi:segregation and condensation protein B
MMLETIAQKIAALEALLFIHGEPISFKKIDAFLGLTPEDRDAALLELQSKLASDERGLTLLIDKEKVQLVTKSAFSSFLETFMKEELSEDLTPASLETLAIIAYLGPISRSRIEYLRGVNSLFTLRNLRIRGLIERFQDDLHPNVYLYRPSFTFLKHVGADAIAALPEYEKFHAMLTKIESGQSDDESSSNNEAIPPVSHGE